MQTKEGSGSAKINTMELNSLKDAINTGIVQVCVPSKQLLLNFIAFFIFLTYIYKIYKAIS